MSSDLDRERLRRLYSLLMDHHGPRRWWPVTPEEGGEPRYDGGPRTDTQRLEVILGAILTQNTAWRGAARAVGNLYQAGLVDFRRLLETTAEELAPLLRPSGYYNRKALKIKTLVSFLDARYGGRWQGLLEEDTGAMRGLLLSVKGIGPETADSIVLYAAGRPSFVIDAYTRRLMHRLGWGREDESYDSLKRRFEEAMPREALIYREYHALIVRHCVDLCRKRAPLCARCPLNRFCERRGVPAG